MDHKIVIKNIVKPNKKNYKDNPEKYTEDLDKYVEIISGKLLNIMDSYKKRLSLAEEALKEQDIDTYTMTVATSKAGCYRTLLIELDL